MKYFSVDEFKRGGISWYEYMCLDFLQKLDDFRHVVGVPVWVSPHPLAVGRQLGQKSKSYHNVDFHGVCRAADVFIEGMTDAVSAIEIDRLARHVGLSVGLYPDWSPRPGLHLDNRPKLKRWGAIKEDDKQVYVTFEQALVRMGIND